MARSSSVTERSFNSARLETKGVDIGAHYRLPETPFGNFRFGFEATYIEEYYNDQHQGVAFRAHLAGHFDKTFGNFARWRALAARLEHGSVRRELDDALHRHVSRWAMRMPTWARPLRTAPAA